MKAKDKKTGNIYDVTEISYNTNTVDVRVGDISTVLMDLKDVELILDNDEIDWEQRMYDLSKEIYSVLIAKSNGDNSISAAEYMMGVSLMYAEVFIMRMKG